MKHENMRLAVPSKLEERVVAWLLFPAIILIPIFTFIEELIIEIVQIWRSRREKKSAKKLFQPSSAE